MNVLIIEDEPHAAKRLRSLLMELEPSAKILEQLDSVADAVKWFKDNAAPDVVFMDIQLADGISFLIFEQCDIVSPIIFITAYDQYALKAFKVNSIDYILKPVDREDMKSALDKLKWHSPSTESQSVLLESIGKAMTMLTKKFKTRFVIKVGERLRTLEVVDILFFYSQDKTTFCHTLEGRSFILDFTLEQLEEMVDPELFHRVNRKYLTSTRAIQDIIQYSNSRLKLILKGSADNDIIVARERVQGFRSWLDQ